MSSEQLSQSEIAVLEMLNVSGDSVSQRELARRTGLSLGLINAVIKRLVQTGYVKTSHLNRRQLEYLLTAQGFAQTAMRSYRYIVDTTRRYREVQMRLRSILNTLSMEGVTEFHIHGDGDLAELVVAFFVEDGPAGLKVGLPTTKGRHIAILNASPKTLRNQGWRVVNLVTALGAGNGENKEEKNS